MRSFVDHSNRGSSSDRQRSWLGKSSIIYASKKHTTFLKHPDYNGLWLHTSIFCRPIFFRREFWFSGEKLLGDRAVRFVLFRIKSEFFSRNWLRAGLGSGLSFFLEKVNPWSLKRYVTEEKCKKCQCILFSRHDCSSLPILEVQWRGFFQSLPLVADSCVNSILSQILFVKTWTVELRSSATQMLTAIKGSSFCSSEPCWETSGCKDSQALDRSRVFGHGQLNIQN